MMRRFNQHTPARTARLPLLLITALIAAALIAGCSISLSTARLSEETMASAVDEQSKKPTAKTDTFTKDSPVIYATALISGAPDKTPIEARWFYVTEDLAIGTAAVETTATKQYVAFHFTKPDNGFPAGDYKVDLYLNGKVAKTLTFKVA